MHPMGGYDKIIRILQIGYPAKEKTGRGYGCGKAEKAMGKIFYIMGKSASGKDHFYESLINDEQLELYPLVLYTTRPIRKGEKNGREYWFVDESRLCALRDAGRIIEERTYHTVCGDWHYFTADEGQIDLARRDYLAIGTLESYGKLCKYFGETALCPIYIEVEDGIRLRRAIEREERQERPNYPEMCRRFLADCKDFSEEKIRQAGIRERFSNNTEFSDSLQKIRNFIQKVKK